MGRRNKTKKQDQQKESVPPPGRIQHVGLSLLVFSAGAVLMALEIAGSRVLAPHFGSSVFVWGSLISVFLIALSVGYYLGGHIADRHPSRVLLNSICIGISFLIFAIAFISNDLCRWLVAEGFGEESGPFVASMLLFLPASVGMGVVSPFAIRLATESVESVGTIAGRMYALSTIGSIAGTLVTTFVLIPLIGLSVILKSLAVILFLVAVLTMPFWKRKEAMVSVGVVALLAFACALSPAPSRIPLAPGDVIVDAADTPYHHVSVVDNGGRRQMRFDRYIQSTVEIAPPHRGLSKYTHYFHLPFLVQPKIERTLFIGAGGGLGPRAFHLHDPEMEIDMVDIDRKVLEFTRKYFFLEDTPKIRTFAKDGRMFVRKAEDRYDCVVLDAFTMGGQIPFHLVTTEFLELCRDKMTEDGIFVMNISNAIEGPIGRIFRSMYRTMESVFSNTYVFVLDPPPGRRSSDLSETRNIILLATKSDDRILPSQWAAYAARFESDSYITRGRMQEMVADLLVDLPDVSQDPVFTDDYAPIETMPFSKPGR